MKTFRIFGLALFTILLCLSACSGGDDEPIEPTPKPEVVKSEIAIDSNIIFNGLSFTNEKGEQSISFTTNDNWTLSVATTTSGATWCTASATSGIKGNSIVKFTVTESTDYDDRSVSVTIKSGTATKTFKITQKCKEALLVTTNKYEISQEGGTIEIEVKANISYKMEISEKAKDWIKESSNRALTAYKHKLDIAANEEVEKREGEITFKSGDKVETVKVYQVGGTILLLSQNEFNVSDKGETISVDIKSNVDYGVQMPDVDWITYEASSRGFSSHNMKYIVKSNDTHDNRSAEIIFYDKNSNLTDTLKVIQAQKDAIIIGKKEYEVKAEGETIEVELESNVDFEISIKDDWIKQVENKSSRALVSHKFYFHILKNESEKERSSKIDITDKTKNIIESIIIKQKNKEDDIPYITFKANAEQTLTMSKAVETLEYSVNNGTWTELNTTTVIFGGDNGDLRIRGKSAKGTAESNMPGQYSQISFGTKTKVSCSGDIRTLVDYENYTTTNTSNARFCYLFEGCTSLITAPELLATKLVDYCYAYMFRDCTSLTSAPELPATNLSGYGCCYEYMFSGCTSLTEAPELPATTLALYCYGNMFKGCISLTKAPELPAEALTSYCYVSMFEDCTNLMSTPKLPARFLASYCYHYMFKGCTSLTEASELRAFSLQSRCYSHMFEGCTSLTEMPRIFATNLASRCCTSMFSGCTSLTKTFKLPATNLASWCYSSMFSGCTSLTEAPELPATNLESWCYGYMFADCVSLIKTPELPATNLVSDCYTQMFIGCSKLNEVTMLATSTNATDISDCLSYWLEGVSSTGTFIKAKEMTSLPSGPTGIPYGWTLKNYGEE